MLTLKIIWWTSELAGWLVILHVLNNSAETGDDPWVWIPFLIFLPFIAVPVYLIMHARRRVQDRMREIDQLKTDRDRGGYVSRRVTTEQELRDQYHRGRTRRR